MPAAGRRQGHFFAAVVLAVRLVLVVPSLAAGVLAGTSVQAAAASAATTTGHSATSAATSAYRGPGSLIGHAIGGRGGDIGLRLGDRGSVGVLATSRVPRPVFLAAETGAGAVVRAPAGWNAATKLPSGRTVQEVGQGVWRHGLPSAERLAGMSQAELRGLASFDDAMMLRAMYPDASSTIATNATAPVRVQLIQQILNAYGGG
jgi:hypothetical protein